MNAATINSAFGIGLGETRGSIETGKIADLLILDCIDYREIAFEFGGNLVQSVVKKGSLVALGPKTGGSKLKTGSWNE